MHATRGFDSRHLHIYKTAPRAVLCWSPMIATIQVMIKQRVHEDVVSAVQIIGLDAGGVLIERPRQAEHGDYSTNIALKAGAPGRAAEIAKTLSETGRYNAAAAGGFVNISLKIEAWHEELKNILNEKEEYGSANIGKKERVNVEFISANPTGPLTAGNARGGFVGDVLANVLQKMGFDATREYYFNDAGTQVQKLLESVRAHAVGAVTDETQYRGEYIAELARDFEVEIKTSSDEELGKLLTSAIFERYIKGAIERMGVNFDVWTNERNLVGSGEVEKAFERLKKEGLLYEKDEALWVKTESLGDTRDRVVKNSNGDMTYLGTDIAYHIDILEKRGFSKAIKIWGADHAAQAPSLRTIVEKLLTGKKIEFVTMQFVRLLKGGEEFKISKRAGTYITVEELLEEIGVDAARYFMLQHATNTHIELDIDLAKEQSQKNPVYYVQYSYARAHQIMEKSGGEKKESINVSALQSPEELLLIKKLAEYPELLETIALSQHGNYDLHKLTTYAHEVATAFHVFYENCYVIENGKVNEPRLLLVKAYQIVLKDVLGLLGISAPERM